MRLTGMQIFLMHISRAIALGTAGAGNAKAESLQVQSSVAASHFGLIEYLEFIAR